MSLFGRRRTKPLYAFEVTGEHGFDVEVRGESFHMQDVLAAARGPSRVVEGDRLRCEIRVRLRREPDNEHDGNAIVVLSETGRELGHVAREVAASYAPVFDRVVGLQEVDCGACVFGRRVSDGGWRAGVWLGLPTAKVLGAALAARDHARP
jgi:hypothetical protein